MAEMIEYLMALGVFVATVGITTILYLKHQYTYWKRRNVPFLEPQFPFGNLKGAPRGIGIGKISYDFYHEFKKTGTKIGGKLMQKFSYILDSTVFFRGLYWFRSCVGAQ